MTGPQIIKVKNINSSHSIILSLLPHLWQSLVAKLLPLFPKLLSSVWESRRNQFQEEGNFQKALSVPFYMNSSLCHQLLRRNFWVSRVKSARWYWEREASPGQRGRLLCELWHFSGSVARLYPQAVYLHLPFSETMGRGLPWCLCPVCACTLAVCLCPCVCWMQEQWVWAIHEVPKFYWIGWVDGLCFTYLFY